MLIMRTAFGTYIRLFLLILPNFLLKMILFVCYYCSLLNKFTTERITAVDDCLVQLLALGDKN